MTTPADGSATTPLIGRRIVFSGLGALGVAAALAGCSSDGGSSSSSGGGGSTPTAATGTELASVSEIPVGGGVVLTDQQIVITQPTEGEFKAFSSLCTHQNLPVTSVKDGEILCARHGSVYSAASGEPESGPAGSALASVAITISGDKILAA